MFSFYKQYGLHGLIRLSVSWTISKVLFPSARLIRQPFYIRGRKLITWGRHFTTGVGVRLDAFGQDGGNNKLIVIGDKVQLNDYVHIGAVEQVTIGNDVLIASKVYISDHNHGQYNESDYQSSPDIPPASRPLYSSPVVIKDRVWIGENVCILPGVTIGEGSIIGAGAIVTHDIPPESIAVGNPAKVIKRFNRNSNAWLKANQD